MNFNSEYVLYCKLLRNEKTKTKIKQVFILFKHDRRLSEISRMVEMAEIAEKWIFHLQSSDNLRTASS